MENICQGKASSDDQQDETLTLSQTLLVLNLLESTNQPLVTIIEQPASQIRFRYESERLVSIPGANNFRKTYPRIKIENYVGVAIVVASCVTKDEPYRQHPHKLVDKERPPLKSGVCCFRIEVKPDSKEFDLRLCMRYVKNRDLKDSLIERQRYNIDPFKTGFSHMQNAKFLDLNAIRLCFQVFLSPYSRGLCLKPVVSNVIYNKKPFCDPILERQCPGFGTVRGGTEVILLCNKVKKEEIEVIFYLEENEDVLWEAKGNIILVHKEVCIVVTTPAFRDQETREGIIVQIRLRKILDDSRSNSLPFKYIPHHEDDMSEKPAMSRQPYGSKITSNDTQLPEASTTGNNQNSPFQYPHTQMSCEISTVPFPSRHIPPPADPVPSTFNENEIPRPVSELNWLDTMQTLQPSTNTQITSNDTQLPEASTPGNNQNLPSQSPPTQMSCEISTVPFPSRHIPPSADPVPSTFNENEIPQSVSELNWLDTMQTLQPSTNTQNQNNMVDSSSAELSSLHLNSVEMLGSEELNKYRI